MDVSIDPPSFGVQLEATGAIRETEAPRLRPRQACDAAPPPLQPDVAAIPAAVADSAHTVANGAQQGSSRAEAKIKRTGAVYLVTSARVCY